MVESKRPIPAATIPFAIAPRESETTSVKPKRQMASNSGVPTAKIKGRRIGIDIASTNAPKSPPQTDAVKAAP